MLYIIIAILIILLVVISFLYWRLTKKYQELTQTVKLRESIVDNKVIQISNIEDTMEHNKALLIHERARIDEQLAAMAEAEAKEKAEKEVLDEVTESVQSTENKPVETNTANHGTDETTSSETTDAELVVDKAAQPEAESASSDTKTNTK